MLVGAKGVEVVGGEHDGVRAAARDIDDRAKEALQAPRCAHVLGLLVAELAAERRRAIGLKEAIAAPGEDAVVDGECGKVEGAARDASHLAAVEFVDGHRSTPTTRPFILAKQCRASEAVRARELHAAVMRHESRGIVATRNVHWALVACTGDDGARLFEHVRLELLGEVLRVL